MTISLNKKISITLSFLLLFLCANLYADSINSSDYENLKKYINLKYENQTPKEWSEKASGVKTRLKTKDKVIALTMDACGGVHGSGYDKDLITFLEEEKVPATLFINARWIDANLDTFQALANNPLFEIANHGILHKPASVNGKSIYNIQGTKNIDELVDEIELNAKKIENITGKTPKYYRSGTAYYDEIAVKIANDLEQDVIGFSILGDAGATFSAKEVEEAFLKAKGGEIAIVHFNQPKSGTKEGLINAIKELKAKGFRFVKLSDYP